MRYKAEFRLFVAVEFDDDGENDLADQAFDALNDATLVPEECDSELIGLPEQVHP